MALTKARLLKHDFPVHGTISIAIAFLVRKGPLGGFGGCSPGAKTGTRVQSDVPRNENQNEGTFACSPGTKRTRAHSPKPPLTTKPPFLSPSGFFATFSPMYFRKRAEYCFESTVSEERTH